MTARGIIAAAGTGQLRALRVAAGKDGLAASSAEAAAD